MIELPRADTFSVNDVADRDLIHAWEQHNKDRLIELRCRVPRGQVFSAREQSVGVGDLRVAAVRATAHLVARDHALIEDRPTSAIGVYIALAGDVTLESDCHLARIRPGQVLVCDLDRPFTRQFGQGLTELALKVPRASLEPLCSPNLTTSRIADATGPHADWAAVELTKVIRRAATGHGAVERGAILDLTAVLISRGAARAGAAHRASARAFVERHLADPSLSAAGVADAAGISERQLSRLFAAVGCSVPRHILARRLDTAYSALVVDEEGRHTAREVATSCGFSSRAYFHQAFKSRFGCTPEAVRRGER